MEAPDATDRAEFHWFVVDASVWVSYFVPQDVHHRASQQWLENCLRSGNRIVVPTLLLVEVAGAIARRTGGSDAANAATDLLRRLPNVRRVTLSSSLADHAASIAADLRLRGADAVYVALADRLSIPLVSLDAEHLSRTVTRIRTYSPLSDTPT